MQQLIMNSFRRTSVRSFGRIFTTYSARTAREENRSRLQSTMAANKSVTVLAPNGRRQNVKVTPNSTILQVLEEVCRKQGYNPQRYDVKHLNQVLDTNAILRFTALPNNATLEMVPCAKEREVSNVTIGLQLENGQRLMGDFLPTTSLTQVLESLCPDQETENAILIYMHQEVYGKETLEATTLKTLGLTSGRAMLRLMHRNPEALKSQAHVYRPGTAKPSPKENNRSDKNASVSKRASSTVQNYLSKAMSDPLALLKTEKSKFKNVGPGHVVGRRVEEEKPPNPARQPTPESEVPTPKNEKIPKKENTPPKSDNIPIEEKIEFLGDRNALLFNQAGAKALPREDLPDNFFDLTVEDARALMRDARKQREELTEAPLATSAQRELDSNKTTLNKLHKYRRAVIRIQFPNQMVLQGLFQPLETVNAVKDFVKEYLAKPDSEFVLYTTPPRKDLVCEKRLVDENLVPSAIIYYSGQSDLKPELKSKLTDPRAAGVQAIKSRIAMTREVTEDDSNDDSTTSLQPPAAETIQEERTYTEPVPGPSRSPSVTQNDSSMQAPKWFKRFMK